jgi:hypothetical protein
MQAAVCLLMLSVLLGEAMISRAEKTGRILISIS